MVNKTRGPYIGLLDSPGDRIKNSDPPDQTLKREIQEETGIISTQWQIIDSLTYTTSYQECEQLIHFYHLGDVYLVIEYDDKKFSNTISGEDVSGCQWINIQQSDSLTPFAKYALNHVIKTKF